MNNKYSYLGVYRYCECPNGHREHPFMIPHVDLGVNICTHCGGIIRPKGKDVKEFDSYKYYCKKARTCSIKADHATAIKFYKKALKHDIMGHGKWKVFCAIAGEYETMGDYASAEEYWNKCREIEETGRTIHTPKRIAERELIFYIEGTAWKKPLRHMKKHWKH